MKVLLVQKFSVIEPLGLMVIGKALKDYGHQIQYFLYKTNTNEDVAASFFKETVLNYPQERKDEIIKLQKIFMMCDHLPNGWEYAEQVVKHNNDNLKEHLYSLLYRT